MPTRRKLTTIPAPVFHRWQIKLDELNPQTAHLQIIESEKVLAWIDLSPSQLDDLEAGARMMAAKMREMQT